MQGELAVLAALQRSCRNYLGSSQWEVTIHVRLQSDSDLCPSLSNSIQVTHVAAETDWQAIFLEEMAVLVM